MRIQPSKYTGPAKPIPTHTRNRVFMVMMPKPKRRDWHPIDNRFTRAVFLAALIAVLLLDIFYWRP